MNLSWTDDIVEIIRIFTNPPFYFSEFIMIYDFYIRIQEQKTNETI